LRGIGANEYVQRLKELADRQPVGRVRFDLPAPSSQLVQAASRSDVGIHPIPGRSAQTTLCLPNKFFEYAMAGLALCVSDIPEMRHLVIQHELGELISEATPQAIADAVARLTPARIDGFKQHSLEAAHQLCWEQESPRLVSAFAGLR